MRISILTTSLRIIRPTRTLTSSLRTIRPHTLTTVTKPILTHRTMATTAPQQPKINISSNSSPTELHSLLAPLTTQGGRWTISASHSGIEREFKFKTFKKTWEFMNRVAEQAGRSRHHPEWSNVYNTTFIRWTTHSPPGLSMLDCEMATFCDQAAAQLGEVLDDGPAETQNDEASTNGTQEENEGMCGLTDRAVKAGGDCCVPKGKGKKTSTEDTAQAQRERTSGTESEELHDKGP